MFTLASVVKPMFNMQDLPVLFPSWPGHTLGAISTRHICATLCIVYSSVAASAFSSSTGTIPRTAPRPTEGWHSLALLNSRPTWLLCMIQWCVSTDRYVASFSSVSGLDTPIPRLIPSNLAATVLVQQWPLPPTAATSCRLIHTFS